MKPEDTGNILVFYKDTAYLQTNEELEGSCVGCAFVEDHPLCDPKRYHSCVGKIFKHLYETNSNIQLRLFE